MNLKQIGLTREDCVEILNETHENETAFRNLGITSSAIIFSKDMITGGVNCRKMYSSTIVETTMWLDNQTRRLKELEVPFIAYLNTGLYDCFDMLFPD